jgi:hypothetical protein
MDLRTGQWPMDWTMALWTYGLDNSFMDLRTGLMDLRTGQWPMDWTMALWTGQWPNGLALSN